MKSTPAITHSNGKALNLDGHFASAAAEQGRMNKLRDEANERSKAAWAKFNETRGERHFTLTFSASQAKRIEQCAKAYKQTPEAFLADGAFACLEASEAALRPMPESDFKRWMLKLARNAVKRHAA